MNHSGTSLETCMLAQLFVPARKFSFCFFVLSLLHLEADDCAKRKRKKLDRMQLYQ